MKNNEVYTKLRPHLHPEAVKVIVGIHDEARAAQQMCVKLAGAFDTMASRLLESYDVMKGMSAQLDELKPLRMKQAELGMDVRAEVARTERDDG